jgi:hypothetical protein
LLGHRFSIGGAAAAQTRPCVALFFRKIVTCTKQSYPQEALAKFGYRSQRKVEILKNPAIFLATCWNLLSTYVDFIGFFPLQI